MPHFTSTHPRVAHKFAGVEVSVPYVFAEGHALTANEAQGLNRMLASAIGNYYAGDIRRALAAINDERAAAHKAGTYNGPMVENAKGKPVPAPATVADLDWNHQAEFEAKFHDYELGVSNRAAGTSKPSTDPIHTAAWNIASAKVKELIAAKGLKVRDFMTQKVTVNNHEVSKFSQLVDAFITKNEWVLELAKSQVAAMNAAASVTEDLDIPEAA